MKNYWTTATGEEIEYKKLGNDHLLNIMRFIEKKAKDGLFCQAGGGFDPDSFWYDAWTEYGDDVFRRFDYRGLLKECIRRRLERKQ